VLAKCIGFVGKGAYKIKGKDKAHMEELLIFVRSLTGQIYNIRVDHQLKVWEVKDMLQPVCGIHCREQRLIYCGQEMEDHRCISDFSLSKNTTIHVVRIDPSECVADTKAVLEVDLPSAATETGKTPEMDAQTLETGETPEIDAQSSETGEKPEIDAQTSERMQELACRALEQAEALGKLVMACFCGRRVSSADWEAALRKSLDVAKSLIHCHTIGHTPALVLRLVSLLACSNRTAIAAATCGQRR
jgi:hypothetical protein